MLCLLWEPCERGSSYLDPVCISGTEHGPSISTFEYPSAVRLPSLSDTLLFLPLYSGSVVIPPSDLALRPTSPVAFPTRWRALLIPKCPCNAVGGFLQATTPGPLVELRRMRRRIFRRIFLQKIRRENTTYNLQVPACRFRCCVHKSILCR